ncbi:MAG: NADH dehydrogenase (quinone) subunit D [Planctomycetes bacterium]|nr:NADH dehydrogenase (quinone) subunit D [Planctomycetota bacterium]
MSRQVSSSLPAANSTAAPLISNTLHINMGPQHPSTHGVLRLELELDGEVVVSCKPVIGYLHTGIEKTMEARNWMHAVPCTDRIDYLNPLGNNLAFALSVEALFACQIPERAQVGRVLLAELTRINSHLVWVGTGAMDLGALTIFFYCMREREGILDLFEELTGQRMMTSFIRPGGLADDMSPEWLTRCKLFVDSMPGYIDEYEALLSKNPIFLERMSGIGILRAGDAIALGVSGPLLRAAGIAHDVRKVHPYCGYENYTFDVPTSQTADCLGRYHVRIAEMRESVKICQQALRIMPSGPVRTSNRKVMPPPRSEFQHSMEALIHHFKLYTEGQRPPIGEAYVAVESPRGELGFYVVSDGSSKPVRIHERGPSFANLQAIELMCKGGLLADLVAVIASIDPIMGEVDR